MLLIISQSVKGYNYSLIETNGYTLIASGCELTCSELIKAVAQIEAEIHDNSRALYMQALQTRVNQQYMQAYS